MNGHGYMPRQLTNTELDRAIVLWSARVYANIRLGRAGQPEKEQAIALFRAAAMKLRLREHVDD